jgi:dTDP-4-amino-4,6-dideoxygalactose transaminase
VESFEHRFARFQGAHYGVATSNGTTALYIALKSVGVGPEDEVILPDYTFVASASAIIDTGATPIFVDVDPLTYNIDLEGVKNALTDRTRAILPVHFGGRPADMDGLREIGGVHGLKIVEDACQAWGGVYRGEQLGALGEAGCFSFQSSKNITSGEGGIILANDSKVAELSRSLTNCGRDPSGSWHVHYRHGGNYRLTEFQGALLSAQLGRYAELHDRRERAAGFLCEGLKQLNGYRNIEPLEKGSRSSWYLLTFRLATEAWGGVSKSKIAEAIQAEGIPVTPGYSLPLHKQPFFAGNRCRQLELPNTERACAREALWLNQNILLAEEELLRAVLDALEKVFRGRGQLMDD